MKSLLLSLICFLNLSVFAQAGDEPNIVTLPKMITVLTKDGVTKTYKVSPDLKFASTWGDKNLNITEGGYTTRCPQYAGTLASDFVVTYVNDDMEKVQTTVKANTDAADKKNVSVFGDCGGDGSFDMELIFQADSADRFVTEKL
jgi:hypothetical protein